MIDLPFGAHILFLAMFLGQNNYLRDFLELLYGYENNMGLPPVMLALAPTWVIWVPVNFYILILTRAALLEFFWS